MQNQDECIEDNRCGEDLPWHTGWCGKVHAATNQGEGRMTTPAVPDAEDAARVNAIIDGMALQATIAETGGRLRRAKPTSPCARPWAALRSRPAFPS